MPRSTYFWILKTSCYNKLAFLFVALLAKLLQPAAAYNESQLMMVCCHVNESLLWSKDVPGLQGSVYEDMVRSGVFHYKFLLPLRQLRAGLKYYGSASRLRRFVTALRRGTRPLKVGVLGGSVSVGRFATHEKYAWFNIFLEWLSTLTKQPVRLRNGAEGGTPSAYAVACMDADMDSDVDLVLIEFCLNDRVDRTLMGNRVVASVEQLVRRVLALPNKPAVILMQVPIVGRLGDTLSFVDSFQFTSADAEGSITDYYDIPSLCLRNAIYDLAIRNPVRGFFLNQTFVDRHPGDSGHKAMADLVVHLIQEAFIDLVLNPITNQEVALWEQPLPPPMLMGNDAPSSTQCVSHQDFQKYVVASQGFTYMAEGPPSNQKWAYVAVKAGSWLSVRIDTLQNESIPARSYPLFFKYLTSHTDVGTVRVECVQACRCDPVELDAYNEDPVSQTYLLPVYVSQSPHCEINITVLEKTRTKGCKFKIMGFVKADPAGSLSLARLWRRFVEPQNAPIASILRR